MAIAKKTAAVLSAVITVFAVALMMNFNLTASAQVSGKTAVQIAADMGAGWNLGNTLDATGGGNSLSAETSWGNPVTTKAMIDAVKAQGFNTVRVPVSWGNHTSQNSYTIDARWMARVKEVVDYCIDNDMYVILNIHHDNSTTYYYPSETYKTQSLNFVKSIWTQIAAEFKDYDQRLIFETLNEPRLVGTSDEWWFPVNSPNAEVTSSINIINELNQAAVDVIRSSGGNNAERCIMVPGYCASIDGCSVSSFKLPTDTASNRLMVSLHAYTPYDFALNASGTTTFSDDLKSQVDYVADTAKSKFIDNGIPVIIGETGASNKYNASERIKWADYYFGKMSAAGIPCVLWDNNVYSGSGNTGEQHGHLDRSTLQWYDKNFVDTMIKYYPADDEPAVSVPSVEGLSVSARTENSITVKWDKLASVDGYLFEYSVNGQWKQKELGASVVTMKVTGYAPSEAAQFRIKAYKTVDGTKVYGAASVISAVTLPSEVEDFRVKAVSSSVVRLAWTNNTTADGYIIEMYSDGKWTRIAKLTSNSTTEYRVTGLEAVTTYKFRIRSYNMDGSKALYSGYGYISATTNPSAVSNLKLKGRAADALRFGWAKNTTSDGYIVEMYSGTKWTRIAKITSNSTTEYRKSGLMPSTKYKFRIKAYVIEGSTVAYSGYVAISATTNPSMVSNLKLKGRAADALRFGWTKNTTADGYIVEMYKNGKWVRVSKITSNGTTEYRKSGLAAGTLYKFRVRSYKMHGKIALYSRYSEAEARTNPSKVSGLKVKATATNAIRLAWTKNTSADGYILEMYDGGEWVRTARISDNATVQYRKTGLKSGTTYKFRAKTYKMSGKVPLYSGYNYVIAMTK